MTRIAAVVFDFDGLLADSEPKQIEAWVEFLARYGHALEPSMMDDMFGLRVREASTLVQHRLDLPLTPEQITAERNDIFFELIASGLPLMDGALDLVNELRATTGIRLALATSGIRRYIEVALPTTGLDGVFDVVVTGDDVQRGKPEPEIYLAAAAGLGIVPSACLALEDAPHGVRSAKDAGMRCLAIPNEMTRSIPGLDVADAVLPSLRDVLPWLARNDLLPVEAAGGRAQVALDE